MHLDPFDWIDVQADQRRRAGLARALRPRTTDSPLLDLAGNDYLGFARHPEVTRAAADAVVHWGAGATGSRLVTGTTELHTTLESELADFTGFEAALVFSSGYAANLAAVTALTRPGGLLASDRHNHASLIDGCRLSRAETVIVPHADPGVVAKTLERQARPAVVLTESVFSVDGDAMPLRELSTVARRSGAAVIVDDAHGFGILGAGGRGAVAAAGLAGAPDIVCTITLSKALGSQGGAVLGPARVIEHLINTARTFIFDTGLTPAATAAALAGLKLLRRQPVLASKARSAARQLHTRLVEAGLHSPQPEACVLSVRARDAEAALQWAARCRDSGIAVGCFRPPSVPDGISRLRMSVGADLTSHDIDRAADMIIRTAQL